ncbi:MAG: sulfur carrier protein ThiS [Gammaproteobacteria bacterium]|nr:sulfur carrier protein ThiS [Gammaproteobacteria bacterium]
MTLLVNGQQLETPAKTLAELATELGLNGKRYAIEVDGMLISKSRHPEYILSTMQKIEIVHAVGGG